MPPSGVGPMGPDFAKVLAEHVSHGGAWGGTTPGWNADCLGCDWTARGTFGGMASALDAHRAHLAAALTTEHERWLAEWLGDEGTREVVARAMVHLRWPDEQIQDGDLQVVGAGLAALTAHWHGEREGGGSDV